MAGKPTAVRVSGQGKPLTLEFDKAVGGERGADFCAKSYDAWKEREDAKDRSATEAYRRRLLERADPESWAARLALEGAAANPDR